MKSYSKLIIGILGMLTFTACSSDEIATPQSIYYQYELSEVGSGIDSLANTAECDSFRLFYDKEILRLKGFCNNSWSGQYTTDAQKARFDSIAVTSMNGIEYRLAEFASRFSSHLSNYDCGGGKMRHTIKCTLKAGDDILASSSDLTVAYNSPYRYDSCGLAFTIDNSDQSSMTYHVLKYSLADAISYFKGSGISRDTINVYKPDGSLFVPAENEKFLSTYYIDNQTKSLIISYDVNAYNSAAINSNPGIWHFLIKGNIIPYIGAQIKVPFKIVYK